MCSLQYTVYYSQLFNFNVIYKSSYRNKLWQHIEFKTNRNDLKSRKSCTRPKFKNYLFKHPTDCFGYRKSSLQVSNTVPEFTFGTGLHCFIWRSKSVARPWQEPYLCQEIGFLQFVSIVWYDVNILEKINPPTYRPIGEMESRVWEMNIFLLVILLSFCILNKINPKGQLIL